MAVNLDLGGNNINQAQSSAPAASVAAPGVGGATGTPGVGMLRFATTAMQSVSSNAVHLARALEEKLVALASAEESARDPIKVVTGSSPYGSNQYLIITAFKRVFTVAITQSQTISPDELPSRLHGNERNIVTEQTTDAFIVSGASKEVYGGMLTSIPATDMPQREEDARLLATNLAGRIYSAIIGARTEQIVMSGTSNVVDILVGGNDHAIVASNRPAAELAFLSASGSIYIPPSNPALAITTSLEKRRAGNAYQHGYGYRDDGVLQRTEVGAILGYLDLYRVTQPDMYNNQITRWAPRVVITGMQSSVDSLIMFVINLAAAAGYYTNPTDPGYIKALSSMTDGDFGYLRINPEDSRPMGPLSPDEVTNMTRNGGLVPIGRNEAGQPVGAPMFMNMQDPNTSGVGVSVLYDLNHGNMPTSALRYFDLSNGQIKDSGVALLRAAFAHLPGVNISAPTMSFSNNVSLRLVGTRNDSRVNSTVRLTMPTVLNVMGKSCAHGALTLEQQAFMGQDITSAGHMHMVAKLAQQRGVDIHGVAIELKCSREMLTTCAALAAAMGVRVDSGDSMNGYNYNPMGVNPSQVMPLNTQLLPTNNYLGGGVNIGIASGALF